MNIKIKLDNSKYCDGCPCLEDIDYHKLNYYSRFYQGYCKSFKLFIGEREREKLDWKYFIIRPQKCIKENGE